jgi:exopolyphosphatase/pppGpp-phosphohydrolase
MSNHDRHNAACPINGSNLELETICTCSQEAPAFDTVATRTVHVPDFERQSLEQLDAARASTIRADVVAAEAAKEALAKQQAEREWQGAISKRALVDKATAEAQKSKTDADTLARKILHERNTERARAWDRYVCSASTGCETAEEAAELADELLELRDARFG